MMTAILVWATTKGATVWCGVWMTALIVDGVIVVTILEKIKDRS